MQRDTVRVLLLLLLNHGVRVLSGIERVGHGLEGRGLTSRGGHHGVVHRRAFILKTISSVWWWLLKHLA